MKKLALMGCLLALGGCSLMANVVSEGTDEEVVAQRALQRYEAMIAGDYRTAYRLMSPGYRVMNTLEEFKAGHPGVAQWQSVNVGTVICGEDICRAGVSFEFQQGQGGRSVNTGGAGMRISGGTVRDIWGRIDGQWYFMKME